jgi:dipeptidase D
VGCAGGFEQHLKLPITRVKDWTGSGSGSTLLTVSIDHLLGGHSGINIHNGRANALQTLARLLSFASHSVSAASMQLLSFKGGNAANAIPHEATAQVYVSTAAVSAFRAAIDAHWAALKEEFKITEQPLESKISPAFSTHGIVSRANAVWCAHAYICVQRMTRKRRRRRPVPWWC